MKKLIIVEKKVLTIIMLLACIVAKISRGWYHFPRFYVESGDYVKKVASKYYNSSNN